MVLQPLIGSGEPGNWLWQSAFVSLLLPGPSSDLPPDFSRLYVGSCADPFLWGGTPLGGGSLTRQSDLAVPWRLLGNLGQSQYSLIFFGCSGSSLLFRFFSSNRKGCSSYGRRWWLTNISTLICQIKQLELFLVERYLTFSTSSWELEPQLMVPVWWGAFWWREIL